MPIYTHNPYREPDSSGNSRLLIQVLLLSLLFHAAVLTAILLIAALSPLTSDLLKKQKEPATVSLSLIPPIPPKTIFVPTAPDPTAVHKPQPIESAHDTNLKSQSQTARKPDSIMPDVQGKEHESALNNSPNVQTQKQEVSSTPPTPKQSKPEQPTPPQPVPSQPRPTPPQPPKPAPKPAPPKPPVKAQPAIDPDTGLPVLPPIDAATLAPPNSSAPPLAPAPSQPQVAASVHGALGRHGDNSPAAMATELGKYKQYVYSVVGSYWYPDINEHFGTIGVGVVHIRFTIHADGKITDVTVLDGNDLVILRDISHRALIKPAPYNAFSEAMIKEVGDSFTDEFSFSVY